VNTDIASPMMELRRIVTDWSLEGPYTIQSLYDRLEAEHDGLITDCIAGQRSQWAKASIRSIIEGQRTIRERVESIIEMAQPEWKGRVHPSLLQWPVTDDNLWKALPDMTRDDCLYVAEAYRRQATPLLRRADFLEQLTSKLRKNQTIKDVYDMDTLADLWANNERTIT
jgi:hypothetical protein